MKASNEDMQFRTTVEWHDDEAGWICPASHLLLLGSCFADAVGGWLQQKMPSQHICINPFGTLYNPHSIATALHYLINDGEEIPQHTYIEGSDGMWHNLLFAGIVSAPTLAECQARVAQALTKGRKALRSADHIFITLSTDHVYRWIKQGAAEKIVVANCHKEPARYFAEEVMSIDETISALSVELEKILQIGGKQNTTPTPLHKRIVFTLSPFRYLKHGMHESALSKARLMISIDEICKRHAGTKYFPAYEIINDELRDYRFYAPDMIHPSPVAVEYIGRRLMQWTFTPEMKIFSDEYEALTRDFSHRLLHPDSPEAQKFITRREEKKKAFCAKYNLPDLCLNNQDNKKNPYDL
jgi:lysophospholipase L1-like esterase